MNKFLFKSTDADFKKLSSNIETIQKNVLYLTFQIDFIRKILNQQVVDKALQSQATEYFEDNPLEDSKQDLD